MTCSYDLLLPPLCAVISSTCLVYVGDQTQGSGHAGEESASQTAAPVSFLVLGLLAHTTFVFLWKQIAPDFSES